jgi:hypothetical protein
MQIDPFLVAGTRVAKRSRPLDDACSSFANAFQKTTSGCPHPLAGKSRVDLFELIILPAFAEECELGRTVTGGLAHVGRGSRAGRAMSDRWSTRHQRGGFTARGV